MLVVVVVVDELEKLSMAYSEAVEMPIVDLFVPSFVVLAYLLWNLDAFVVLDLLLIDCFDYQYCNDQQTLYSLYYFVDFHCCFVSFCSKK